MHFLSIYCVTLTLTLLMYLRIHLHGTVACSGALRINKKSPY
jgi:hypothetical protein